MKKIVNILFLLVICLFPAVVDARQTLELEYEKNNRFFLHIEDGNYYYADKSLYEGDLYIYDEDGNYINGESFFNDDLSLEENYSLQRYKALEDIVSDYYFTIYNSSTGNYYYVNYLGREFEYNDIRQDGRWVNFSFDDDINLTKEILGERYNVYNYFKNQPIYIYRIDVFENIIVLHYEDEEENYKDFISIYDKEYNLIKKIDLGNYSEFEMVKEIDGIIYYVSSNKEIVTYKLDGSILDTLVVNSDWLDEDKWDYCGTYEISTLDALNNKLFVVYDFKRCPPSRIVMPDDSALNNAADMELPAGFTQVYSLEYDVEKINSSNGDFTYDLKIDEDGKSYVELKVTPKDGYVVDKIIVTDINGNKIDVTDNKFYKPMNDVKIEVQYKVGEYLPIPDTGLGKSITVILIGLVLISLGFYTINYGRQE